MKNYRFSLLLFLFDNFTVLLSHSGDGLSETCGKEQGTKARVEVRGNLVEASVQAPMNNL